MINGFVEQPCYLDEFVCLDFINEGVSPILWTAVSSIALPQSSSHREISLTLCVLAIYLQVIH